MAVGNYQSASAPARGSNGGHNGGHNGGRNGGRGRGRGRGRGDHHQQPRSERDVALNLPQVLFDKRPFRANDMRYDMARFVEAAAALDATLLNEFLLQLGHNDDVLNKLRAVVAFRFDVQSRSFQDIALPLLQLLASRAFLESVHASDAKKVLRIVVGEPFFFRRVRSCIECETDALLVAGLLARSVCGFTSVLHAVVRKLPDSATDDDVFLLTQGVAAWVQTFTQSRDGLPLATSLAPAIATLRDTLEMCIELVPARRPVEETPGTRYLVDGMRGLHVAPQQQRQRRPVRDAVEAAGFAHGPRHDNDAEDIRDVNVIPTDLEMRCVEPPHLPARLPTGTPLQRHLDFQFRLLREDVLAQIRRGLQWLLHPATLAACMRSQRWTPPREANAPQLNVALGVRLEQLKGSLFKGVMFEISAAQPALKNKSKQLLRAFWEKEQRYKPGSLVCIASNVQPNASAAVAALPTVDDDATFPRYADLAADELVFATVCESDPKQMAADLDRFSVRLRLLETHRTAALVTRLTNRQHANLLIEVRGLFFTAYEPILRTLQQHDARSLAPALQRCLYGSGDAGDDGAWQCKPAYLEPLTTYDLQFLVTPDIARRVDLRHVPATDYAQLVRHLRPYERAGYLTLDASQVEAFAAAMTQQVSLIQGPPGTGKSYVGTKIVRGILEQQQSASVGPILCVCYTNHALDQFLEGLIADGVPLASIVRVGSRSKSEVLQSRALHTLKHEEPKSRQERYRFWQLMEQCRSIETETLDGFVDAATSTASFLGWMQSYHTREYAEVVELATSDDDGDDDNDRFAFQDQTTKARKKRWRKWARGERLSFATTGLWVLPANRRTAMVATWEDEWRESTRRATERNLDAYNACVTEVEALTNAHLLRVLKTSRVVGVTTTGCAINQALLRALAPAVVVCEEAGEVLEAHVLACLSSATQHVIQIGDHKQLRPILNEFALSCEAHDRLDLDVSMFERLVGERTSTAAAAAAARTTGALVTLHVQRRMRAPICDLVRYTLYPQLEDGAQVAEYPHARGFTHNLWYLDHDAPEMSDGLSPSNAFEAELVVELAAYAIKQGYAMDAIAILTPYLGQLVAIRRLLHSKNFRFALDERDVDALRNAGVDDDDSSDNGDDGDGSAATQHQAAAATGGVVVKTMTDCVRLSTVDNFQGNEADVVFISTVRSNKRGATGFLKTSNRVNVMLSRARHAMYVVGSAATVRRSPKATMFNTVLDILEDTNNLGRTIGLRCQRHGTVVYVASARDIRERSPDGGCHARCDQRLRCGHSCAKLCHADDPHHVAGICMEPCVKRVAACGHLCKSRCADACRCRETVAQYQLPCGHMRLNVPCADIHRSGVAVPCTVQVTVELPFCKHTRVLPCTQARLLHDSVSRGDWAAVWQANVGCTTVCGGTRTDECNHACRHACGQCLAARLDDGEHTKAQMEAAAARTTTHFGRCPHPCERALLCGHSCAGTCHAASECPPCDAPCRNTCSHSACPRPCKDPCASCAEPCAWSCVHSELRACELPCGSPCTRLPCDLRCTKQLAACGHQCPGVCGEPCLPSAFCRECPPTVCTRGDDVVDLVMATTLSTHNPDESPLALLRCGHCFTVETLDGWLGLADFYEQDRTGKWAAVKPLQAPQNGATPKGCPTCRAPVAGVHRYGRLVNFYALHQSELKYLQTSLAAIAASAATRTHGSTINATTEKERNRLIDRFRQLQNQETPTQEVSTKESSRLAQLGLDGDALNLNSFRGIMQSQAVLLVRLELLALLVAKLKTPPSDGQQTRSASVVKHTFNEGKDVEKRLLAMARASDAHRSTQEALLLGMELRVAFLHSGHTEDAPPHSGVYIRDELESARDTLQRSQPQAPSEKLERAARLCEIANHAGALTDEEKQEIFRVFAANNGAFAQGFGGHWYQCPSGHPYVITECGGAMQVSRCPECGATIGGTDHQLDANNAPATAFFR